MKNIFILLVSLIGLLVIGCESSNKKSVTGYSNNSRTIITERNLHNQLLIEYYNQIDFSKAKDVVKKYGIENNIDLPLSKENAESFMFNPEVLSVLFFEPAKIALQMHTDLSDNEIEVFLNNEIKNFPIIIEDFINTKNGFISAIESSKHLSYDEKQLFKDLEKITDDSYVDKINDILSDFDKPTKFSEILTFYRDDRLFWEKDHPEMLNRLDFNNIGNVIGSTNDQILKLPSQSRIEDNRRYVWLQDNHYPEYPTGDVDYDALVREECWASAESWSAFGYAFASGLDLISVLW